MEPLNICPNCKAVIDEAASGGSTSQAVSAAPPASRGHSLQDSSRPESLTREERLELRKGEDVLIDGYTPKETMDMIWANSEEYEFYE